MKHIPILFSTMMVRALLEGRKTQTRRILKSDKADLFINDGRKKFGHTAMTPKGHISVRGYFDNEGVERYGESFIKCPYGKPGDVLWVRESWCQYESWSTLKKSYDISYLFKADGTELGKEGSNNYEYKKWKPSIHMPKAACRIFLEVVSAKVERLHDISEADIDAEGFDEYLFGRLIERQSKKVRPLPEYWVNGDDESLSYCNPCALKRVTELKGNGVEAKIDGGWPTEGDTQATCNSCGEILENTFTTCACEYEIEHFEKYGFSLSSNHCCYLRKGY